MNDMCAIFLAIQGERQSSIERELIRRLEILYDRVPANEEVARDVKQYDFPDGTSEFRWRGKMFMVVPALEWHQ